MEIVVQKFLERPTVCRGGAPTALNTDTIEVHLTGALASIDIRLDGGPLAPGATTEGRGASEIEVHVIGSEALADVIGTAGSDEFRWAPGGAWPGLNVNPGQRHDRDVDVTVSGGFLPFIVAEGKKGADRILPASPSQRLPGGAFSEGGKGNDVLVASRSGDILDGGKGKDLIRGGPSFELISGGTGRDQISGAGGSDEISAGGGPDLVLGGAGGDSINSRDSSRDRVRCGAGFDHVKADRRDRLSHCEQVRSRGLRMGHRANRRWTTWWTWPRPSDPLMHPRALRRAERSFQERKSLRRVQLGRNPRG
jgi:Ca2+-binding RTX toxin-like protein